MGIKEAMKGIKPNKEKVEELKKMKPNIKELIKNMTEEDIKEVRKELNKKEEEIKLTKKQQREAEIKAKEEALKNDPIQIQDRPYRDIMKDINTACDKLEEKYCKLDRSRIMRYASKLRKEKYAHDKGLSIKVAWNVAKIAKEVVEKEIKNLKSKKKKDFEEMTTFDIDGYIERRIGDIYYNKTQDRKYILKDLDNIEYNAALSIMESFTQGRTIKHVTDTITDDINISRTKLMNLIRNLDNVGLIKISRTYYIKDKKHKTKIIKDYNIQNILLTNEYIDNYCQDIKRGYELASLAMNDMDEAV